MSDKQNEKVILYSTGCPKCRVLEQKLNLKHVDFSVCDSEEEMRELGLTSLPVLSVDGRLLSFSEAVKWVNEYN